MIKTLKLKNHVSKGFTLVETLIVLAITMLILAIILIAVPDLQRSARNNERHADADALIAAIDQYYALNDKLPTILCTNGPGQPVYFADGSGTDSDVSFTPGFFNQTPASPVGSLSNGICTGTDIGGESSGWIHIIPIGPAVTFPQSGASPSDSAYDHIVVNMGSTCDGGMYTNQNQPTARFKNASAASDQYFVAILDEEGNGNWAVECFNG